MRLLALFLGILFIASIIWEAFEVLVLPRRVSRRLRLSRLFFVSAWIAWRGLARAFYRRPKRRDAFLALFGPLSLLMLLSVWAFGMIVGFAMMQWGLGSALRAPEGEAGFLTDLYMSASSFFTLGLGDVVPRTAAARIVTVVEAGMGFGFLAIVIAYLPVLYQAFSRREATISLLDARAGSPPSAGELLRRHAGDASGGLERLLADWEHWSAELLESHISYPVLAFYRSQHSNQSWLSALTTILDACALLLVGVQDGPARQARLTFAIARHAVVDLAQVLYTPPRPPEVDRLSRADWAELRDALATAGYGSWESGDAGARLSEYRRLYEPYVNALGHHLELTLPRWVTETKPPDNWQTSAWERLSRGGRGQGATAGRPDEHL